MKYEDPIQVLRDLRDDPMADPPPYWNWMRTSKYWEECAKFWQFNAKTALERYENDRDTVLEAK